VKRICSKPPLSYTTTNLPLIACGLPIFWPAKRAKGMPDAARLEQTANIIVQDDDIVNRAG